MRSKAIPLWISVAAAATTAMGAVQVLSPPDVVVSDRYSSPETGDVRLIGICDIHETSIVCWDPKGKLEPDLANQVASLFTEESAPPAGPPAQVPVRLHRKNRVAVFENPDVGSGYLSADGAYHNVINHRYVRNQPGTALDYGRQYVPFDAGETATSSSLYVELPYTEGRTTDLPLRPGASATVGAKFISIASISPVSESDLSHRRVPAGTFKKILFKIVGEHAPSSFQISVEPVDEKGGVMDWVDRHGKPMIPLRGNAGPQPNGGHWIMPAEASIFLENLGGREWPLQVDPRYVAALRMTLRGARIVVFKDMPLDPK